ncbi:CDGSH iron-sulfur domain-containing protein [Pseudomonas sp.]|uniref:CDGSH iron-sulfur domain-containing protein n=1 Tax=Pseudomonas sp. TaxID=306 RepID=UPI0032C224AD
MSSKPAPILPEVRQVKPGDTLLLCRCGRSPQLPDCSSGCSHGLRLEPVQQQLLLLCRCARSRHLPYCDGSHNPPVQGFRERWRRFWWGL